MGCLSYVTIVRFSTIYRNAFAAFLGVRPHVTNIPR